METSTKILIFTGSVSAIFTTLTSIMTFMILTGLDEKLKKNQTLNKNREIGKSPFFFD